MGDDDQIAAILEARHGRPHDFLGMHRCDTGLIIRAFLRDARAVDLIDLRTRQRRPMERLRPEGFYELRCGGTEAFPYLLEVEEYDGRRRQMADPYSFLPSLSDFDCFLFNRGKHEQIYDRLGANRRRLAGQDGFAFAVWAPNAARVSAVGDFNGWDGRCHAMRPVGSSGIWEIFLPDPIATPGQFYGFELRDGRGNVFLKSDPFGRAFQSPPNNASILVDGPHYCWHDEEWMQNRAAGRPFRETLSIYEVHLGSWRRGEGGRRLTYGQLADRLIDHCHGLGFTHVELLPIMEHPYTQSWGYQTTGFFAPTWRHGSPADFMAFVDRLHGAGIGVILDWVPGHFPKDSFALAKFDGTCLYEHEDPRIGEHRSWGTLVFNHGRHEVRNFLLASAQFWCEYYHIDGLRVDAVASMIYRDYGRKYGQWIPNGNGGRENLESIEFLKELNVVLHRRFPGVLTIAEESSTFEGVTRPVDGGGLGFDFKWNMGWMHDVLEYFRSDPAMRREKHSLLTFGLLYQYSENFVLALSHDEVVHGKSSLFSKMPSADFETKARMLRSLLGFMWLWPGKKSLFMGGEFGQVGEWRDDGSLDWPLLAFPIHDGLRRWVTDLNGLYGHFSWLGQFDGSPEGFRWVNADDAERNVFSFLRCGEDRSERLLVFGNFSPVDYPAYEVSLDPGEKWLELLNSEESRYGSERRPPLQTLTGNGNRLFVSLPAFSVVIFQPN